MGIREHYPGGRFGLMATALAACLAMSQVASAITVTYSTSGAFDGPGANGNELSGIGTAPSKLKFYGMSATSVDVSPPAKQVISLGQFVLSSTTWGTDIYAGLGDAGQSFELLLTQSAPTPGSGNVSTLVLGGIVTRLGGFVGLVFKNTNFSIGEVDYEIEDTVVIKAGTGEDWSGVVTARQVSGDINVVPLPAAAWGGIALMGLVGAGKLRHRASLAA